MLLKGCYRSLDVYVVTADHFYVSTLVSDCQLLKGSNQNVMNM